MGTVGYGDVTPKSGAGSVAVSVLVIISVLYMAAMPLGIIGCSFTQIWQERDKILLMHRTRERLAQWGLTVNDILTVFVAFDVNKDGVLDLEEFRALMRHLRLGLSDSRIVNLFECIDDDGGGT